MNPEKKQKDAHAKNDHEDTVLKEYLLRNPNPTIKILVLGAAQTGKRSLCTRFTADYLPEGHDPKENGQYRRLTQMFPSGGYQSKNEGHHQVVLEIQTRWGDDMALLFCMHPAPHWRCDDIM
jgi:hypothetical protein